MTTPEAREKRRQLAESAAKKYQTTLVVAIIAIAALAIGGVVAVGIGNTTNSTPVITSIIGFAATIMVSLFGLMKTDQNKDAADRNYQSAIETKEKIEETNKKVEEKVTETKQKVEEVSHKIEDGAVKKAVREALEQSELPSDPGQLQNLINDITEKVCKENADFAAQQHLIKHAVANIANFLGLVGEVKRLELEDKVDKSMTGALNPVKKPDCG
jgi:esterase/lipase